VNNVAISKREKAALAKFTRSVPDLSGNRTIKFLPVPDMDGKRINQGELATKKIHNAPSSIEVSLFDASVPEVELVLAGGVLALAELRKMQKTGRCGLAMSGTLTTRREHVSAI
jgi:hypothetical protein